MQLETIHRKIVSLTVKASSSTNCPVPDSLESSGYRYNIDNTKDYSYYYISGINTTPYFKHSPGILTSDLETYFLVVDRRGRETSVASLHLTENEHRVRFEYPTFLKVYSNAIQ